MSFTRYYAGLDLGQAADYTALAILQQTIDMPLYIGPPPAGLRVVGVADDEEDRPTNPGAPYACVHLQRWPLGTSYAEIVKALGKYFRTIKPGTAIAPLWGIPLAVDQTGVGRAVVEMLGKANLVAEIVPIVITGGHAQTYDDGAFHVPKKELVSVLQVLLQGHRLKIAKSLPEAAALARELQTFKVKITVAANETFEAWRERDHDDLVLAVALGAWLAERRARDGEGSEAEGAFVCGEPPKIGLNMGREYDMCHYGQW